MALRQLLSSFIFLCIHYDVSSILLNILHAQYLSSHLFILRVVVRQYIVQPSLLVSVVCRFLSELQILFSKPMVFLQT